MSTDKSTVSGKAIDVSVIRRIFRLTAPYKSVFYAGILLTLVIAVVSPMRPWLVQYTIDKFLSKGDAAGIQRMTLLLVGLLFFQSLLQYFHTFLTNQLGQTIIRDLRVRLFRHITFQRLKFFDRTPIGTLITRNISDLETIADIFSEGLIVIIGDLLTLFFIVAFMFLIDWKLALISLSTVPFLMIATYFFKNGIKEAFREVRTEVAALNTFLQEHITGMSVVQIFNRENQEMGKFKVINRRHMKAHVKSVWYYSIFYPVVELLSAASVGLLVWWGSQGALEGVVTIGNVVAFIMYINMLFRPIRELADKFNTFQMGMVSSERVFRMLDEEERISETGDKKVGIGSLEIRFKGVWFSYDDQKPDEEPSWVLKDLTFDLPAGTSVALVGATGAGKSS
ncbi:MAG: ABC transporter transmembrane domain-containing protein, partial [Bacteroidota bacterium]